MAPGVVAQSQFVNFYADLDEAQVVPPSGSINTGEGELVLNLSTKRLTYRVQTTCVGPIPVFQLGIGDFGQPGAIIFEGNFGAYDMYEGTTPALTDAQVAILFQEGMFVAISTTFPFPGTIEIRGQLRQTVRHSLNATLSGGDVVPPTTSKSTGNTRLTINLPENKVRYEIDASGLAGENAELRSGAPGQNGTLIATLAGNASNRWCGLTEKLTDAQIDDLIDGNAYVTITSASHPGGEIRGQLGQPPTLLYIAEMNGEGVVPEINTGATGLARFVYDQPTRMLSYEIEVSGMTATRLEIGTGFAGKAPPQSVRLPGGPTLWSGQVGPLPSFGVELLNNQGLQITVKSATYPDGEIRGQIFPNPYRYGFGSESGAGRLRIGHRGTHVAGSSDWEATLSGAVPGSRVRLFVGTGNTDFRGDPIPFDLRFGFGLARSYLWVDAATPRRFAMDADDAGCATISIGVPSGPSAIGVTGYYQWVAQTGTTSNNLSVSDAFKVVIQ